MGHDPIAERLDALAAVPLEWAEYARWLREQHVSYGPRDYLFSEDRPRFEPRAEDVVVALPGLRVTERAGVARLELPEAGVGIDVPGIPKLQVAEALAAIDGRRRLIEARWESGLDAEQMGRILRVAFGRVLVAPQAVAALETQLPGSTLVRFPCAPYAIERPYWENMLSLRRRMESSWNELSSLEGFVALLRRLHVVALMGGDLRTFYKPASPASDLACAPGALYLDAPHILPGDRHAIFVRGPRVNVSLVGGEGWYRALSASVGDPQALDAERRFEEGGLDWGTFLSARSEKDVKAGDWFLPPRPMAAEHFEALRARLVRARAAAQGGREDDAIESCAAFHRGFVRLHPFHYANQSVAMNIVNAVLGTAVGAGIPHLLLDLLALRMSERGYAEVFRRAVRAWAVTEQDPAKRFGILMGKRGRMEAAVERMRTGGEAGEGAAEALVGGSRG